METITNKNQQEKPVLVCLSLKPFRDIFFGEVSNNIDGMALVVNVTNNSKEDCYIEEPVILASVSIPNISRIGNAFCSIQFPTTLGYNKEVCVAYKLTLNDIEVFRGLLSQDENATITAVVRTLPKKEKFESKPYYVAELVKNAKYVKDDIDVFDHIGN